MLYVYMQIDVYHIHIYHLYRYMYMSICMHMSTCVNVYRYVYMCICMYICIICVSIQACNPWTYVHTCGYKDACLCVPVYTHVCTHVCLFNLYRVILLSTSNLCMLSHVCLASVMSFEIQRECLMPGLLQTHSYHAVTLPFLLLMNMFPGEHTGRICPLLASSFQ